MQVDAGDAATDLEQTGELREEVAAQTGSRGVPAVPMDPVKKTQNGMKVSVRLVTVVIDIVVVGTE